MLSNFENNGENNMASPKSIGKNLNKKKIYLSSFLFMIYFFNIAYASVSDVVDFSRGDGLLTICKENLDKTDYTHIFEAGICLGYIRAVSDVYEKIIVQNSNINSLCYFMRYQYRTNDQIIRVIVKYLEDNPQLLDNDSIDLIQSAIKKAFPVPKQCEKTAIKPTQTQQR